MTRKSSSTGKRSGLSSPGSDSPVVGGDKYSILAVLGPQATTESITARFRRKMNDIETCGLTMWVNKSYDARPHAVQEMCKLAEAEGQDVWCYFLEPAAGGGHVDIKPVIPATLMSVDGQAWTNLPEGISHVSAIMDSRADALVFDKLEVLPSRGRGRSNQDVINTKEYHVFKPTPPASARKSTKNSAQPDQHKVVRFGQGRSSACAIYNPNVSNKKEHMNSAKRRVIARARLARPYAVLIRSSVLPPTQLQKQASSSLLKASSAKDLARLASASDGGLSNAHAAWDKISTDFQGWHDTQKDKWKRQVTDRAAKRRRFDPPPRSPQGPSVRQVPPQGMYGYAQLPPNAYAQPQQHQQHPHSSVGLTPSGSYEMMPGTGMMMQQQQQQQPYAQMQPMQPHTGYLGGPLRSVSQTSLSSTGSSVQRVPRSASQDSLAAYLDPAGTNLRSTSNLMKNANPLGPRSKSTSSLSSLPSFAALLTAADKEFPERQHQAHLKRKFEQNRQDEEAQKQYMQYSVQEFLTHQQQQYQQQRQQQQQPSQGQMLIPAPHQLGQPLPPAQTSAAPSQQSGRVSVANDEIGVFSNFVQQATTNAKHVDAPSSHVVPQYYQQQSAPAGAQGVHQIQPPQVMVMPGYHQAPPHFQPYGGSGH